MDFNCPYCGTGIEVCHDDGFGYEQDVKHQMECPSCEKNFVFQTYISFDYDVEIADCLNDDDHDYKLLTTYPREFSKMECKGCGERRELTDDERIENNIGTKEDYFKSLKNSNG